MSEIVRADDLGTIVRDLRARLDRLEREYVYRIPHFAADPTSPDVADGAIWWNSTDNQLRVRVEGATRTITTT